MPVKAVRVHEYHTDPRLDDVAEPKIEGPRTPPGFGPHGPLMIDRLLSCMDYRLQVVRRPSDASRPARADHRSKGTVRAW